MLIEHGIDDVDERLVAIEKTMPAGEQISFQPAFALVLAQHFHHLAGARQILIVDFSGRLPLPIRALEHRFETVGDRFIRPEDAEVALL